DWAGKTTGDGLTMRWEWKRRGLRKGATARCPRVPQVGLKSIALVKVGAAAQGPGIGGSTGQEGSAVQLIWRWRTAAIWRTSAVRAANSSGRMDCMPSESALSGS